MWIETTLERKRPADSSERMKEGEDAAGGRGASRGRQGTGKEWG
jgi:hypothetical protein